ncbi:MAG: response regulator transcription factor [Lachnospiraceae bacterium]|nr:response regulator transcription factor [Lachnospiraceae bacterium]
MAQSVLIVEDEPMIREAVASYLEKQGCKVFLADNGVDALVIFEREAVTFIILDLMLPDMSGEEICTVIRKKSRVPIIMLTAKTQEEDVLRGLTIGADDYMTKPFSLKELYARMNVILRRSCNDLKPLAEKYSWNDNDLKIDFEQDEIYKNGEPLSLTPIEWKILSAFIRHPKKIFTREELIGLAFEPEFDGYDRVIDTHIKNLRKKVEDDPKKPVYLKTVHGIGYKFGGEKQ